MAMSRKDLDAIADALNAAKPRTPRLDPRDQGVLREQWVTDCEKVADRLQCHVRNFKRERFLKACGVEG